MGEELLAGRCVGKACDYAINLLKGEIGCINGTGACVDASMLSVELSSQFYDQDLAIASESINNILTDLYAKASPKAGMKLSFVTTDEGVFLAWTNHNAAPEPKAIKRSNGHAAVKNALKLK